MVDLPLILKLKKEMHKEIAKAQDIIIEELYKVFDRAVFHGGTAIWRCYKGNRFSEDIDVYIPRDRKKIERLFENLKTRGFVIHKKKIGERSLFSVLQLNRTIVRLEAIYKKARPELKEYELSEGNLITVYTLSPEELLREKVDAYLNRAKVRDLYDVFFLLRYVKNDKEIIPKLKKLINNFKQPFDEKDLKILIIEGVVPDIDTMLRYIKRRT
ncbi:hypothetical protein BMS3Abin17_00016 [archaeon BMS3Abin17]|nr:hypothetical protein BMS3Abin17_00016 [archaeon BMS3Abin17]HDZ61249.1 hypothetical protein [Candidatus Pacearchaeota archaeon]